MILAIDQGTHATRSILFDADGKKIDSIMVDISLNRISETVVEQGAEEIINSIKEVVYGYEDKILKKISAAGLTTQRSSVVAWESDSLKALSPVISWQDRRVYKELDEERSKDPSMETWVRQKTGLPVSPHYGAGKLRWLLQNNESVKEAHLKENLCFGPLSAFIVSNLLKTDAAQVDDANASRTLLWNINTRSWDSELLNLFGINEVLLPTLRPVLCNYGNIHGTNIQLSAVSGDQNSAVLAGGDLPPGTAVVNMGSGAFILLPVSEEIQQHGALLRGLLVSSNDSASYTLEGTVNGAALALTWACEKYSQTYSNDEMQTWLNEITEPPVFVNSVGGLGSPFWNEGPKTRWLSPGIEPGAERLRTGPDPGSASALDQSEPEFPEAIVAVAESILFLININLEALFKLGAHVRELKASGGLAASSVLLQKLANLTGLPVVKSKEEEASAKGIAWLAASRPESWTNSGGEKHYPIEDNPLKDRYKIFYDIMKPYLK